MSGISRRRLLVGMGAATVVAAGGLGFLVFRDDDEREVEATFVARVAAFFGSTGAVAPLGLDYLDELPSSTPELAAAVAPAGVDAAQWFAEVTDEEFAQHVRDSARLEFAAGEAIDVGGWWLAPTEARCCAIAARSRAGGSRASAPRPSGAR